MGAVFVAQPVWAEKDQLQNIHDQAVNNALCEDGNGGYTGTIAESTGLTITDEVFEYPDVAYGWLENNAEKWDDTLAVRVEPKESKPFWMFGGNYSE